MQQTPPSPSAQAQPALKATSMSLWTYKHYLLFVQWIAPPVIYLIYYFGLSQLLKFFDTVFWFTLLRLIPLVRPGAFRWPFILCALAAEFCVTALLFARTPISSLDQRGVINFTAWTPFFVVATVCRVAILAWDLFMLHAFIRHQSAPHDEQRPNDNAAAVPKWQAYLLSGFPTLPKSQGETLLYSAITITDAVLLILFLVGPAWDFVLSWIKHYKLN